MLSPRKILITVHKYLIPHKAQKYPGARLRTAHLVQGMMLVHKWCIVAMTVNTEMNPIYWDITPRKVSIG